MFSNPYSISRSMFSIYVMLLCAVFIQQFIDCITWDFFVYLTV